MVGNLSTLWILLVAAELILEVPNKSKPASFSKTRLVNHFSAIIRKYFGISQSQHEGKKSICAETGKFTFCD